MQYAQIIPNTKTDIKTSGFTYKIPPELLAEIQPGILVQIPFAAKKIAGLIFDIKKQKPKPAQDKKIKSIIKVIARQPQITKNQVKLAYELSKYYHTSLSDIIFSIVPMPLLKKTPPVISKIENPNLDKKDLIFSTRLNYYQKLISQIQKSTKQTILLFPKVELAEKFFYYLTKYFPKEIVLYHSKLSKSEKWQAYQKILNQKTKIIVGSQNAIFVPVQNLAQIIIDSADNPNYKQDRTPKYDVRKVAQFVGQIQNAKIIFTSPAIPLDYWRQIKTQKIHWQKIDSSYQPQITLIDMNQEKIAKNFGILSEIVKNRLIENFKYHRQSILFINKKGAASVALCQDCRYIFRCPNCDSVLTYHARFYQHSQFLICHSCSYQNNLPADCPHCHGVNIKLLGGGTEKVEMEVKKILPAVKIIRIEKELPQKPISQIKNSDVIVATSALFFNYFQKASLVAMILPDLILNLPDFRAVEKTFEQIKMIQLYAKNDFFIQTYYPENWLYQAVAKNSDTNFYTQELSFRKKKNYPPFAKLIKLIITDSNSEKTKQQAQKLAKKINQIDDKIKILGPAPTYSTVKDKKYLWQIILKGNKLNHILPQIPQNIKIDIDPVG